MNTLNKLKETVDFISSKTKLKPKVAITLGSGLAHFVDVIDVDVEIPYSDIPHFSPSSVVGHPGKLVIGTIEGTPVAILQGRIHYYEGHSMEQVIYPTRSLIKLGAETFILTNAAGGIDPKMIEGQFMIITDHINLTGTNPLIGFNHEELGPRFPDMTNLYDPELCQKMESIFTQLKTPFTKGVYCGVTGPTYETAAEIKFMQTIGGHAVGMSTVPEAIAIRHMGCRLAGVSCITNLATGLSTKALSHDEVKEVASRVEQQFCGALKEFVLEL